MEINAISDIKAVKNIPKIRFNNRFILGFGIIDKNIIKAGIVISNDAANNFVGLSK